MSDLANRKRKRLYLPFIIILVVFLLAAGGGTLLLFSKQRTVKAEVAAKEAARPAIGKPGAEPPHIRGSTKANITLEEFGDFECPPCGLLSPVLEQLEKDYAERLRVIFREFPMPMHKHAMDAARAAEAAGLQGRFWEMHDMLYHNRFIWPASSDVRANFNTYAETLKLDLERFKKDFDSEQVNARIKADKQRATSLGVDRTPVLFVNNHQLPVTAFNPPGLHEAIDAAANPALAAPKPKG
jgi:protein-disulfide isomerase